MAGAVSIAALARLLSRRKHRAPQAPEPDPAVELKAKLAASREPEAASPEPEGGPAAQRPAAEPEPLSVDERRAQVHAKGQQAIDEMRGPDA
jgi:hypothetical protein